MTALDSRERIWKLFSELAKFTDPALSELDHQLITLDATIISSAEDVTNLQQRIEDAGGTLERLKEAF